MNNHEMFKKVVEDISIIEIGVSLGNNEKIQEFLEYVTSSNIHMYFTIDNFKVVTEFINDSTDIRDLILNIVEKSFLEYIGNNGTMDSLLETIVTMVEITKNTGKDTRLYDSRLADTMMFNKEQLYDLLVSNVYLIVVYYIVLNQYSIFNLLLSEEDNDNISKKV